MLSIIYSLFFNYEHLCIHSHDIHTCYLWSLTYLLTSYLPFLLQVYGRFAAESIRHCIFFLDPHVNLQQVAAEARKSEEYEYNPTKYRLW